MSCRCITPFSLLNAYTGPVGRSGVPMVSWFKNAKGYLWWRAAPVLPRIQLIQGNQAPLSLPLPRGVQILTLILQPTFSYKDKFRFTSMAVAISLSFLPRPGSSVLIVSVIGFSCCPAWWGPVALGGTLPCVQCEQRASWLIFVHLLTQCTLLTLARKAIVEPSGNSHY